VGQNVTFTISLTNQVPDDATVEVTDVFPAGLSSVNCTPSLGSYDGTLWTLTLPANSTETLTCTADVDVATPVVNSAEVTSSSVTDPDSTPDNDLPGEDDQDTATVNGV
jgi:uncharacterized repeat protein (TIGR01451 family)